MPTALGLPASWGDEDHPREAGGEAGVNGRGRGNTHGCRAGRSETIRGKHRYGVTGVATVGDEHDPTTGGSDMPAPTVAEKSVSSRADQWSRIQPPPEGYTADDLDRMPDLPPHTELIDASPVLVSPQKRFHMRMLRLLEMQMVMQVPEETAVEREMATVLGNGRDRSRISFRSGPKPHRTRTAPRSTRRMCSWRSRSSPPSRRSATGSG